MEVRTIYFSSASALLKKVKDGGRTVVHVCWEVENDHQQSHERVN